MQFTPLRIGGPMQGGAFSYICNDALAYQQRQTSITCLTTTSSCVARNLIKEVLLCTESFSTGSHTHQLDNVLVANEADVVVY